MAVARRRPAHVCTQVMIGLACTRCEVSGHSSKCISVQYKYTLLGKRTEPRNHLAAGTEAASTTRSICFINEDRHDRALCAAVSGARHSAMPDSISLAATSFACTRRKMTLGRYVVRNMTPSTEYSTNMTPGARTLAAKPVRKVGLFAWPLALCIFSISLGDAAEDTVCTFHNCISVWITGWVSHKAGERFVLGDLPLELTLIFFTIVAVDGERLAARPFPRQNVLHTLPRSPR